MQLASVYDQIRAAGADLWAISPQSVAQNDALRRRRELPFPILADADQQLIRAWGLYNHADPKQRPIPFPAAYLVGAARRVLWAYPGIDTRDRPTPGQILDAVRRLTPPPP